MDSYLIERPIREIILCFRIIEIVRKRQRQMPLGRGVLPVTVQCFLDEYRAEQTLRRDMSTLARIGLLERIGGEGSRRGYRVAA